MANSLATGDHAILVASTAVCSTTPVAHTKLEGRTRGKTGDIVGEEKLVVVTVGSGEGVGEELVVGDGIGVTVEGTAEGVVDGEGLDVAIGGTAEEVGKTAVETGVGRDCSQAMSHNRQKQRASCFIFFSLILVDRTMVGAISVSLYALKTALPTVHLPFSHRLHFAVR